MDDTLDLLIEIGTEELPPQALWRLSEAFEREVINGLQLKGLAFIGNERFASPRRLGIRVNGLACAQPDQETVRRGPALQAAFDAEGKPSKAATGFAASCGVAIGELEREETAKGSWLIFRKRVPGQPASALIPPVIADALAALPIPKRMRWGNLPAEFVRPVHWVVLLLGSDIVDTQILGVRSGRESRGHRFHRPEPLNIRIPADYEAILREQGMVEPVFEVRRERIRTLAERIAADAGMIAVIKTELLDEVTALCEWPVAIMGSFDPGFLRIPAEVLMETMQKNQKYFPVLDQTGRLAPHFITISNIESRDPDQVRAGNERVIRPRFKDAAFFWEQDLQRPLDQLLDGLGKVVFQHRLGSVLDKVQRLALLSDWIASKLNLDPSLAIRSAMLCKCDLLTNMVGEFGNLQGVMGRYYAEAAGEDPCVSAAIEEHYLPRHAGDRLPQTPCGQILGLADRLDSLLGIFAIGLSPSGIKDPYGLRRAALGVLRILIETPLALNLRELVASAAVPLQEKVDAQQVIDQVVAYMLERLYGYYNDQGIRSDIVEAVLAVNDRIPSDIDKRIRAMVEFRGLPEADSLAAANKRIRNILRKADLDIPSEVHLELLELPQERALYHQIEGLRLKVQDLFKRGEYGKALGQLASLRNQVDAFFDAVMVMAEDMKVRSNRLALLKSIASLFEQVADFSRLQ